MFSLTEVLGKPKRGGCNNITGECRISRR